MQIPQVFNVQGVQNRFWWSRLSAEEVGVESVRARCASNPPFRGVLHACTSRAHRRLKMVTFKDLREMPRCSKSSI